MSPTASTRAADLRRKVGPIVDGLLERLVREGREHEVVTVAAEWSTTVATVLMEAMPWTLVDPLLASALLALVPTGAVRVLARGHPAVLDLLARVEPGQGATMTATLVDDGSDRIEVVRRWVVSQ